MNTELKRLNRKYVKTLKTARKGNSKDNYLNRIFMEISRAEKDFILQEVVNND